MMTLFTTLGVSSITAISCFGVVVVMCNQWRRCFLLLRCDLHCGGTESAKPTHKIVVLQCSAPHYGATNTSTLLQVSDVTWRVRVLKNLDKQAMRGPPPHTGCSTCASTVPHDTKKHTNIYYTKKFGSKKGTVVCWRVESKLSWKRSIMKLKSVSGGAAWSGRLTEPMKKLLK